MIRDCAVEPIYLKVIYIHYNLYFCDVMMAVACDKYLVVKTIYYI
jgi:hypothetical protein